MNDEIKKYKEPEQLNLFFPIDILEPNFRDIMPVMAIPIVSISKKKRTTPIEYERKGIYFKVEPHQKYGVPTIWDFDVLIYITSILNEARNQGKPISRFIEIVPHRLFIQCKWIKTTDKASGREYQRLEQALDRLQTASNITNIQIEGVKAKKRWSWISEYNKQEDDKGRIRGMNVVLSEWMFTAIMDRKVLSIPPEYFKIRSGISKYLFRIMRKMIGSNDSFRIKIETIMEMFPPPENPTAHNYRNLKRDLLNVIEKDELPEYSMEVYKDGKNLLLAACPRPGAIRDRRLPRKLRGVLPTD